MIGINAPIFRKINDLERNDIRKRPGMSVTGGVDLSLPISQKIELHLRAMAAAGDAPIDGIYGRPGKENYLDTKNWSNMITLGFYYRL